MVINGIVQQKLSHLQERLEELEEWDLGSLEEFARNSMLRSAVERHLQVCVEILVDVCERYVALARQEPGETSAENLRKAAALGIISSADAYAPMVRFRNFIVHRYERINPEIVYDIAVNRLGDLARFIREVKAYEESRHEPGPA